MSEELANAICEAFREITGLKAVRVFRVGVGVAMVEAVDGNTYTMRF